MAKHRKIHSISAQWVIFTCIIFAFSAIFLEIKAKSAKPMIFKKQIIEGKLKKPQIVLISADQRPRFEPMAIDIVKTSREFFPDVQKEVFESFQHEDAFKIEYNKFK